MTCGVSDFGDFPLDLRAGFLARGLDFAAVALGLALGAPFPLGALSVERGARLRVPASGTEAGFIALSRPCSGERSLGEKAAQMTIQVQ